MHQLGGPNSHPEPQLLRCLWLAGSATQEGAKNQITINGEGWLHGITISPCSDVPFQIALHRRAPVLAHHPRLPCLTLWLRVLVRIPPFPCAFPILTGSCWSPSHPTQWVLAISSQTPQLASDKRQSLVSLTAHLSPFLPTALWTLFSCPFHLCLVLETDHLASSFWLTSNPQSHSPDQNNLFLLMFFLTVSLIWKQGQLIHEVLHSTYRPTKMF